MNLSASGHPLHTRSITLHVTQRDDSGLRALGRVIDLRKLGFVPMMGDLQPAGIVHNMVLDARVDPRTRILESLESSQPSVAVEVAPVTAGECCRDPAPRLQALVGKPFDARFAAELNGVFGGPLGCSHLLTLFHEMAAALPIALDYLEHETGPWRANESIFRRSILLDGFQTDAGQVQLCVQLSDFGNRPESTISTGLERLAWQHEVQASVHVDPSSMKISDAVGTERRRDFESLSSARWSDRGEELGFLVGQPILPGLAGKIFRAFEARADTGHLLRTCLHLAPGFIQAAAGLSQRHTSSGSRGGERSPLHAGGHAGSCYMWRTDGPLLQLREKEFGR